MPNFVREGDLAAIEAGTDAARLTASVVAELGKLAAIKP